VADSASQAWTYLRGAGLLEFLRAVSRRTVDLVRWSFPVRHDRCDLREWVEVLAGSRRSHGDLIWAMQQPSEFRSFLEMVREHRPGVVLEIGTAAGGMLFALTLTSAEDALLLSVDLPGGKFGGGYARWREPIYRRFARPGQRVVTVRGDSHSDAVLSSVEELLGGRPIDLLFIDGDHTYEGVREDFEKYSPLLSRRGIVAFHDITPLAADPSNEVPKFWAEVSVGRTTREFRAGESGTGYGIGVILPRPEGN
jgi:predicted O-methyltransferase YrrM